MISFRRKLVYLLCSVGAIVAAPTSDAGLLRASPIKRAVAPFDETGAYSLKADWIEDPFTLPNGTVISIKVNAAIKSTVGSKQAPKPGISLPKRADFVYDDDPEDLCNDSSFINVSSDNSPSVPYCDFLRLYSRAQNYYLTAYASDFVNNYWVAVVSYGNCVFAIHSDPFWYVYIGNTDVADLVQDSIAAFQCCGGKIGAEGWMHCDAGWDGYIPMRWAIFRI
jgi:hypothetical protein